MGLSGTGLIYEILDNRRKDRNLDQKLIHTSQATKKILIKTITWSLSSQQVLLHDFSISLIIIHSKWEKGSPGQDGCFLVEIILQIGVLQQMVIRPEIKDRERAWTEWIKW